MTELCRKRTAAGKALVPVRTSTILRQLAATGGDGRISIGDIVATLGDRGCGLILLACALPCCLPMPPGVPSTAGWIIAFISINMMVGRDNIWLPAVLSRRTIERPSLYRIVNRCLPHVERMERFCRPRTAFALNRGGRALIGFAMLIPAILLILPIPIFGNIPPGISAAIIAIAVCEGDGLIALVGAALALLVLAVTTAATWGLAQSLFSLL